MIKPEIKIVNEIVVYENKYGKLYDDDVMFIPQEQPGKYIRWKWNASYSVGILPITKTNEFILVESFRHAARKAVIEVPKGYGEDGISPLEIAKKELSEEVNLESEQWEYLGEFLYDTSFTYHPMKLFIAWDCAEVHLEKRRPKKEISEAIIAIHSYPFSTAPEMIKNLGVYDLITLFTLMKALERRK